MSPLVSILCITYNHENYIADAIEGFLAQKTTFEYEILIGEDCSTDGTRKVVERYMAKYPDKIKMIAPKENIGASKNWRNLFEVSEGKYIAECEGDDYWTDSNKLQEQIDYLEANPDCTLCFHAVNIVKAPKIETGRKIRSYRSSQCSPMRDIILGGGIFCPTSSIVYPKRAFFNAPEFCFTAHVGDYPVQLVLASKGYAYYMERAMSSYRTEVKGSWTTHLNNSSNLKERMVSVNKADIAILTAFNEYTHFRYEKIIKEAIYEKKYAISINSKIARKYQSESYEKYRNQLSLRKKSKLIAYNTFPRSYELLAQWKNYFTSKKIFD